MTRQGWRQRQGRPARRLRQLLATAEGIRFRSWVMSQAGAKPELSNAKRILIVRLGAIGDVIRVLPALARLRRDLPAARIGWVVEHWVEPILRGHPDIDQLHILDRRSLKSLGSAATELRRLSRELAEANYEVALDFHGRAKSGLVTRLSGIPQRIGFARGDSTEANFLFTNVHVKLEDRWENRVLRFLHLLAPLGVDTSYDPHAHGLRLDPDALGWARGWYQGVGRPQVVAFPGTSLARAGERWPAVKWGELLRRLGEQGARSVVLWGPAEEDLAKDVVLRAGGSCRLAPPTSLPQMMALVAQFSVYVGSDTAAMHMAWMQGVPTVVFSGPKPKRTAAPLPPVPARVLRADEYFREGRPAREQPADLVAAVGVDDALAAVTELLASAS